MSNDLLIALRGLRRTPSFTLLAVATLALGIGANATIFSVVDAVLLRPLAGFETHRLLRIQDAGHSGGLGFVDPEAFRRIRKQTETFEQLAGMQFCQFAFTGNGDPEQVVGPCVTANWFEVQRAQAMQGRTFLPGEDLAGRNRVVVLDHGFWQRRFGGSQKIIGQTMVLDKEPWLVIGVMPPDFKAAGVNGAAIYTPYVLDENAAGLYVTGRLKPNVTMEQAQAELRVLVQRMRPAEPRFQGLELKAATVLEDVTGPASPLLRLLWGAVAMVLLIACVNVANLFLARSGARQKEVDIRTALGATRWRIVRFLLAESLLICLAASIAAVGIAYVGLHLARPLIESLPRAEEVGIDMRVFVCCLAAGLPAAVLFGVLPVFVQPRAAGIAGMHTRSAAHWQGSLVASEVALAFVLLAGSGLLLRTFVAMRSTNLGYDPRNVLTHFYSQPPSADGTRAAGLAMYERLREKIGAIPGVIGVATATTLPMGGVTMTMDVQVDGQPASRGTRQAALNIVSGDYFRTAGIPLRVGRTFARTDREGTAPVVVVSESIAQRYFAGHAIGKRIVLPRVAYNVTGSGEVRPEIVGVAGNICVNSVADCQAEHIYLPESQNAIRLAYFLIRTSGDPLSVAGAVKRAASEESPLIPLDAPQTLEQRTGYLMSDVRQGMWLIGVFAVLAVVLAASGVYGVSNYLAGLRRKEMGIRMALGATLVDNAGLIYRQTLWMAVAGLCVGLIAAAWLSRFLEAMLFQISAHDPSTLGIAALSLLAIVLLAALMPALRAGMVDPARELRRE